MPRAKVPESINDMTENYPKPYVDSKTQIADLLVASEAKRLGIDTQSPKLEEVMFQYLSSDDTMLSEEGVKVLNAYSSKGFHMIREFPLIDKPTSREKFLEAFYTALQYYAS